MDINNAAILDEELEKKESLRIELAGLIDSKNYEGINSEAIKERIDYLNKEIENNNELRSNYNLNIQEENNRKFDTLLDGILANNINTMRKDELN